MSIESTTRKLDSLDAVEPTQKLVTIIRQRYIQRQQQSGNQATSQTILPTTYDLSVVVPTKNEPENIEPLLESLQNALRGLCVEIIFLDESDDDTSEVIEEAARTMNSSQFHIQLEHRF